MKTTANSPSIRAHYLSVSRFIVNRLTLALVIFLVAFGVRVLTWHDTRLEVGKVQTVVAENYKTVAQLLRQDGIRGFFSSSSPLAHSDHLGHPPGYSVLLSLIRPGPGASDAPAQFLQIFLDALSAVLIFLIVAELSSPAPAVIVGLLAAFSPQLAWNSVLLLPDSLSVFPILLAAYLLALSRKRPRFIIFIAIGALVGISCWLRANALMMTIFFAASVPLLLKNRWWWPSSLAIVCGTLLIILPLTLRNAIVFHRLIPVSLGAGQTMLEGIADYDKAGRFNIPATDRGIMKQEAEVFQRPDYNNGLLNPDGIQRERWRLQRAIKVIGSHPLWFGGVMIRRAGSMLKLERARLISINPAVTYPLHLVDQSSIISTMTPADLSAGPPGSGQTKVSVSPDSRTLSIFGDDSNYGTQFSSPPMRVRAKAEYLLQFQLALGQGRVKIAATDGNSEVLTATILDTPEGESSPGELFRIIDMPFTTSSAGDVRLVVNHEASTQPAAIKIGTVNLYQIGPARNLWTRYPRFLINGIQRGIVTATILPLAILGLGILVIRKCRDTLIILSVVPLYYFCVQSIFHTEYRYVLAVNYFLFALAAVGICWIGNLVVSRFRFGKEREA
jgi:hypothetical protein